MKANYQTNKSTNENIIFLGRISLPVFEHLRIRIRCQSEFSIILTLWKRNICVLWTNINHTRRCITHIKSKLLVCIVPTWHTSQNWEDLANSTTADALALCVTKPSTMLLDIDDKQIFFIKKGFKNPYLFRIDAWQKMLICFHCFSQNRAACMGFKFEIVDAAHVVNHFLSPGSNLSSLFLSRLLAFQLMLELHPWDSTQYLCRCDLAMVLRIVLIGNSNSWLISLSCFNEKKNTFLPSPSLV